MKANLYPGRGTLPDWNDLDIRQREQMPAHAYRITFPDLASCRHALSANRRYLSPYVINLSDGWECRLYPDILQLPENILSFRSGFEPTSVPGGMTVNPAPTTGRTEAYPFPVTPPLVPSAQPVLVYRRTCRLPLLWGGLRKRLVLQGIGGAAHVFANGKLAGYTQGSCLPAEFDLTAVLHDGDNELFILAYPYCTESFLEQPDPAGRFGLIREIYCEATPPVGIQDVTVRTMPAPDSEAWRLDLAVSVYSCRISTETPQVRISLWQDAECLSETLWPVLLQAADSQGCAAPVQSTGSLAASLLLPGILPWNDENPVLYDLYVVVEDRSGKELSCQHQAIGFRHLDRNGGQLQINGRPLQLRAARLSGRPARTIPDMIDCLRQIKQSHLNGIYSQGYPVDPIFLELCDIFGVYVIDEAPLDISHPLMLKALTEDPRWLDAAREILERLIRRDFNHPCVLFWSAGIFRQEGPAIDLLADAVRALDNTRWLHLADLPDCSRNLAQTPIPADLAWPVGGGMCFCDWERRSPQLLQAIAQALRPLDIRAVDAASGAFLIANRLNWLSAAQFGVEWVLLREGRPILTGQLDNIRMAPGEEQYLELIYGLEPLADDKDYILRFEVSYAEDSLWANAGDEAFFQEFILAAADIADEPETTRSGGRLRLESERHHLIVSGSRFWLVFNRINGALESWRFGDKELIAAAPPAGDGLSGLHGTLFRPPEPMDEPWLAAWRQFGYDRLTTQVISARDGCDGQNAVIEMILHLAAAGRPAGHELLLRYEIRASGDLKVFTSLTALQPDMPPWPCFCLSINMKPEYSQVSWLGTGPGISLSRLPGTCRSGLFGADLADQETNDRWQAAASLGRHSHTRWLSCKDGSGFGLLIRADQVFGHTARIIGLPGLAEKRLERQALAIRLFTALPSGRTDRPVKAIWHFSPVVSDAGRLPAGGRRE